MTEMYSRDLIAYNLMCNDLNIVFPSFSIHVHCETLFHSGQGKKNVTRKKKIPNTNGIRPLGSCKLRGEKVNGNYHLMVEE